MEKERLIVAGFVALVAFAMAVATLSVLMPDWRSYLVLAFPAVVATANKLAVVSMREVDSDKLSNAELIAMIVAYPVAVFTPLVVPLVYTYGGDVYYLFIAVLTFYIAFLTADSCYKSSRERRDDESCCNSDGGDYDSPDRSGLR